MALQCTMSLNMASFVAGQTPPPQATLSVYNPNASPILVTGVEVRIRASGSGFATASNWPMAPIGPGMTTLVPPLTTISIGPFAVQASSAANANPAQMVNQTGNLNPVNPQPSQSPQTILLVGATVYGSDMSVNPASQAAILMSYTSNPPAASQGGFMQFSAPNNLANGITTGVL